MATKTGEKSVTLDSSEHNWRVTINAADRYGTFDNGLATEDGPSNGYLWFRLGKHLELVLEDFSGVHRLPEEVIKLLNSAGYLRNEDIDHFISYYRSNLY
jgi:hypothetical protein